MNEMVTLPKEEYLRLKAIEEDMADLNSAAEVFARIKAGTEELIPSSGITWSEGATSINAPGARASSDNAAAQMAAAVFFADGSIRMSAGAISSAASCSITMKRKSAAVTIVGAAILDQPQVVLVAEGLHRDNVVGVA